MFTGKIKAPVPASWDEALMHENRNGTRKLFAIPPSLDACASCTRLARDGGHPGDAYWRTCAFGSRLRGDIHRAGTRTYSKRRSLSCPGTRLLVPIDACVRDDSTMQRRDSIVMQCKQKPGHEDNSSPGMIPEYRPACYATGLPPSCADAPGIRGFSRMRRFMNSSPVMVSFL